MLKILLVEDNEMNRDMTSHWLLRWGHEVTVAVDGEEAVRNAHSDNPDLILMDLGLPEIDGWEAARRLKADAETKHIPIIAMTGYALLDDRHKALAAGCDDYCCKPVDFPKLKEMIAALLRRSPPLGK